ncbi:hypothetical protein Ocin01_06335 [Orchesella cincta]|uniref:Uncharacterized protein n=1 Tax=Orchesella cincta TaxID=48709 RepID=A0A1D2N5J6_ORCCI|nr:hypothetical protein Ocin01_06335 [Orchesella cincta]
MEKLKFYIHFLLLLVLYPADCADLIGSILWTKNIVCSVHDLNDYFNKDLTDLNAQTSILDTSHETTGFEININSTPISTIFSTTPQKNPKSHPLPFRLNLNGGMSLDETLYLLYLNMANKLRDGYNQLPTNPSIEWKQNVLSKIAQIFIHGCPSAYVPTGYIHMVKELFLHYQTQLSLQTTEGSKNEDEKIQLDRAKNVKNSSEKWALVTSQILHDCLWSSPKLDITGQDSLIEGLRTMLLENGSLVEIRINPPEEDADNASKFSQKDEIIDEAWWMFSFVYGYCFHHFKNSSVRSESYGEIDHIPTATEFFHLFQNDFLSDLKNRWMNAGNYGNAFGTIFGQPKHAEIKRNLRYCVTAAYLESSIEDLQLLRPFEFRYENSRTGTSLQ